MFPSVDTGVDPGEVTYHRESLQSPIIVKVLTCINQILFRYLPLKCVNRFVE